MSFISSIGLCTMDSGADNTASHKYSSPIRSTLSVIKQVLFHFDSRFWFKLTIRKKRSKHLYSRRDQTKSIIKYSVSNHNHYYLYNLKSNQNTSSSIHYTENGSDKHNITGTASHYHKQTGCKMWSLRNCDNCSGIRGGNWELLPRYVCTYSNVG